YLAVAEARHVGARRIGIGVPDLAVCILARLIVEAAQLGKTVQRRTDGPERDFLRRELMARVAVAAHRTLGIVGELLAATFLRDALAVFPVARPLAVGGPLDRRQVHFLDHFRDVLGQRLVRILRAKTLR